MRKSSAGLLALAALIIGASIVPSAQAAQCSFNYEQPFYAWNDTAWYGLAPGGTFETGKTPPGWAVSGGAAVKTGGNPSRPWSSGYSLYLPAGSSATTSAFCVDSASPYARMFATTTTRNAAYTNALRVDLIYTDATTRKVVTKTVGTLAQQSSWNPTATFSLISSGVNLRWDSYGRSTVSYRFTPLYSTAWRIDDLFIDPKKH